MPWRDRRDHELRGAERCVDAGGWTIIAPLAAIAWARREYWLLDMLTPHLQEYDLILIDCRPGIDLSVTNALTAAPWLLVPIECSLWRSTGTRMGGHFSKCALRILSSFAVNVVL